jgi:transcriptional regulator with XRE-family HTH domain
MDKLRSTIAQYLIEQRERAGLSENDTAKLLGLPLTQLQSYENQIADVPLNILYLIAKAYKIPEGELSEFLESIANLFHARTRD